MSDDLMSFDDVQFAENSSPRCPLVLVLDSSSSMFEKRPGEAQSPMESLNAGLDFLVSDLYKDPLAKNRISLCTVVYGSNVESVSEFAEVENVVLPDLSTGLGVTSTGAALNAGLDKLDEFVKRMKAEAIPSYKPFMILLSDGLATDSLETASARIKDLEERKKLSFFAVGVEGADLEQLSSIGSRPALPLRSDSFQEFFTWVSASTSSISASNPGDGVKLPSPESWTDF